MLMISLRHQFQNMISLKVTHISLNLPVTEGGGIQEINLPSIAESYFAKQVVLEMF